LDLVGDKKEGIAMTRHEEIQNAYKALGKEATFYDGMMTYSKPLGKAVCRLVWNLV
jgi:hypothetical protein